MKDMERWAKIQNQKKEIVRAASPVLKGGADDDKKQSKSADAGFAVFERKVRRALLKKIDTISRIDFLLVLKKKPYNLVCVLRSQVQRIFLRSLLLLPRKMKSLR